MTPRFTAALLPILLLAAAGWRPAPPVWLVGAVAPLQPAAPALRDIVARLDSDDPREVARARAELLKPLDGAAVDKRIAYSAELVPELSALSGRTKRDATLINIMIIAGAVATDPGSDLVERYRAD